MSMTFTKLFASITESTIWAEPDHTRIVWITMLAMADHAGRVWASIPGLANRSRVTIEQCESALSTLLSPDKYSRTKDHEGRRIEEIDGGWRLLNHQKYRAIRDEESIKESKRRYINERRAKEREGVETVEQSRTQENSVDRGRHNAEAEAEADSIPTPLRGVTGTAPSAAPAPPPAFDGKNAEALNGKSIVKLATAWELPEAWGVSAEQLGWNPGEVLREAEKFRQYWTEGRGQGTRRSVKGWRQTWSTWLEKAARDKR